MKAIYPDINSIMMIKDRISILDVKIDEIIACENSEFDFSKNDSYEVCYKKKEDVDNKPASVNPIPFVKDRLVLCIGVIIISLIMAAVSFFFLHKSGITVFSVFTAICFIVLLIVNRNDRDIPQESIKISGNDLSFFPSELRNFRKSDNYYINSLYVLADQLREIVEQSQNNNPDNIAFDNIGNLMPTAEGLSFDVIDKTVPAAHFDMIGIGWIDLSSYTTDDTIDFNLMLKNEFESYREQYNVYLDNYFNKKDINSDQKV